jgi:hypothetical protein
MRRKPIVLLAALTAAFLGAARADETPPTDGGLADALAALATVDSALVAWANAEHADSDVKRAVIEAPPVGGEVPQADPARGITAEAAAQGILGVAEQRLADLDAKIRRRQLELVYGATAPPETPRTVNEVDDEQLSTAALVHGAGPDSLPYVGIQLSGSSPYDDRLKSEELGCDPDHLADLIALDLAEEPNATLESLGGAVAVRASPAGLARVRSTLDALASVAARRVQVELRAWRISRALRAELASLSSGVALSEEAEKKLAKEGTLAGEATLAAADGRIARRFCGEARSYMADVASVPSGAVDMVARTLATGFFAEVVPRVDPGSASATLTLRTALVEPRARQAARYLGAEIELPRVAVARAAATATVPLGRTVLVGGFFETTGSGAAGGGALTPGCVFSARATLLAPPREPAPRAPSTPARPNGERALVALDKDTKAEVGRLAAILPVIDAALDRVRVARERHVAVIDVRDLLVTDTGALSLPRLGIVPVGSPEPDPAPSGFDLDRLLVLVRRSTGGDEAWAPPAWLAPGRGALLARQTPGAVTQIEAIVASLRRERAGPIELEAGLYAPGAALAAGLAGALDRDALARLDAACSRGEARLVAGGFTLARQGEATTLLAGDETAYVTGCAPSPGTSASATGIVRSGLRLGVRARKERGGIAVELDANILRLSGLARAEGPCGAIQFPSTEADSEQRDLLLEDGAGFAAPASSGPDPLILVIRARAP